MTAPQAAGAASSWTLPTRASAAWRGLKVAVLVLFRAFANARSGPQRWPAAHGLVHAPVIASVESALWIDGRDDEFVLRCGKVQNLRVARLAFDGVEVAAGQTLSFWSQVGRPSLGRGFAVGREVVSGCVVPTVGGGLCQMSNALASAAAACGIQMTERHQHSARIEAAAPSMREDATVAWNYIDLRLRASFSFRIEVDLTANALVVRIRAMAPTPGADEVRRATSRRSLPLVEASKAVARGCMTCDMTACFRHRSRPESRAAKTALLLNEPMPEWQAWVDEHLSASERVDWMLPWVRRARRQRAWKSPGKRVASVSLWVGLKRMARLRLAKGEGAARQAALHQAASDLAHAHAAALKPEHVNAVVDQSLLVPLWRQGVLHGRSFTVLMAALPVTVLQQRLDAALAQHPEAASLNDFRVDEAWMRDEWAALEAAETVLTAHTEVHAALAARFGVRGPRLERLPWVQPAVPTTPGVYQKTHPTHPLTIAFPASALARKGAMEVAQVARDLQARVLILGTPPSDASSWSGIDWVAASYASDWLDRAHVVVLPAFVEHQPRALIRALAVGLPVVATPACGLQAQDGLWLIDAGDRGAIKQAVQAACLRRESSLSLVDSIR